MKTCKKLLTLALALILLMSVLVLPAMAAPRYAIGPCNYCGGPTVFRGMTDTTPTLHQSGMYCVRTVVLFCKLKTEQIQEIAGAFERFRYF